MGTIPLHLGAVGVNHVAPLYAQSQTNFSVWMLPAMVVLIGFLLLCRKFFLRQSVPTPWLFAISIACFFAIGISVAMIDGYREVNGQRLPAFLEPYTRTSLEYYSDVPKVESVGPHAFLRDYAKPELFSTLSGHLQTHPPGGALFLWLVSKLLGYNLLSASLASIGFTSLTLIPIYWLAKDLYGESVGRYALALFLLTPNFVMFTTTSMDGPFSVFPILSVYLFYRAMSPSNRPDLKIRANSESRLKPNAAKFSFFRQPFSLPRGAWERDKLRFLSRIGLKPTQEKRINKDESTSVDLSFEPELQFKAILYAIFTGLALALGILMNYSTVFIGVFFGVVMLLTLIADRGRFKGVLAVLLIAGLTFVAFYLLMFLFTGFNLLEALGASIKKDEAGMGTGYETIGRYFHLSVANLFAFLIGVGIPLTTVWIRQLVRAIRHARSGGALDIYTVGYPISLLAITFSALFTMEVERIWIFMVPFIVIPVAKYLYERCEQQGSLADFYWVAGLLCVQLVLFEVTLYTYW